MTPEEKTDSAVCPDYYISRDGLTTCAEAIEAATEDLAGPEAFYVGTILKYLWRYRKKNGLEDLRKAKWYLERLIFRISEEEIKGRKWMKKPGIHTRSLKNGIRNRRRGMSRRLKPLPCNGGSGMKPILFNTEMVKAILDGRKTVTRRVVKPQPWDSTPFCDAHQFVPDDFCGGKPTGFVCRKCGQGVCPPHCKYPVGEALFRPYCWPGDTLYVQETWAVWPRTGTAPKVYYKADGDAEWSQTTGIAPKLYYKADGDAPDGVKWRPSIHMPKEAARVFLRVTDVSVERLQDMLMSNMRAEGMVPPRVTGGQWQQWQRDYAKPAWDATIKKADLDRYGWAANPWVWVIQFERVSKEETRNEA